MADENDIFEQINQSTQAGDRERTVELTNQALEQGYEVEQILDDGLIYAMDIIGDKFSRQEIFVPEMLIAAYAMKGAMEILRPILVETGAESRGVCIIGTVEGDLHDIGQSLVSMMWEGAGFEVYNLGTETTGEEFVEAIQKYKPHIVGMSALLTTTMMHMPENIKLFEEVGVRDKVKVMVGGAPISQEFADEMSADAYGPDAATATDQAKQLTAELPRDRWDG